MDSTLTAPLARDRSDARAASIPWVVWASAAAVTSSVIGAQWDIAWHRSIGRDGFWSPPHVAIYLGGVLAGVACAYLILSTTFARDPRARAASVGVWGFRGPLGAFISAWGGIAMIASAPFDNWWHNTYGLDVKILSPPHTVLALGLIAIQLGALILIAGAMNRADKTARAALAALFLYVGGMMLVAALTFNMEYTWRAAQHSAVFYRVVATAAPLFLVGIGRASRHKWGATITAGVYSAVMLALLWIFPLVHAQPKLGPVYNPVTHLIPAGFPLLVIVPAIAIDLLAPLVERRAKWQQAIVLGVAFAAIYLAVQWPFSSFLMTPHTRNWFFGTHYFDYNERPEWADIRNVFFDLDGSASAFRWNLGLSFVCAAVMARIGLLWSAWMRGLRR